YDTAGRTTSKSLSNGSTVQYTDAMTYDFRDRMTQQSRTQSSGGNLWSKFFYNSIDLVTTAEQGSGSVTSNPELVQTTTRDLAGRPTSISYQSGANALATYSMAYVSASNRLASLTTPQGTTNYGYSANGQLIQAGSTGYSYDANGNPTNRAGKTTQIGTWNRLLDDGDFTYQYDAEGRTTGRTSKTTGQTESYVWNRRGQLTQIDVHSNAARTNLTGQVNYSYDPTGRRTSVRNQTGIGSGSYAQSVDYLMSDGDQVGQILGATGQTTRRFRYGIGVDSVLSEQRFSGSTASNPEYQLTDHLGTVRGVAQRTTGVNAVVVNTLQYDSFGKLISQSNASKQPYHGFAGRDIEPVGGLTYNRNRYYSTQTGRFISQDPIGFNAGDENLYRYVGNSPTNATDPTGLWGSPVSGGDPFYFMRQWFNRHFNYGAGYATGGSTHLGPTGTIHSNHANGHGGLSGGIIRYSTAGLANGLTEPPELRSYASQRGFEDSSEVLRLTPLAPSVPIYHLMYGENAAGGKEDPVAAGIELPISLIPHLQLLKLRSKLGRSSSGLIAENVPSKLGPGLAGENSGPWTSSAGDIVIPHLPGRASLPVERELTAEEGASISRHFEDIEFSLVKVTNHVKDPITKKVEEQVLYRLFSGEPGETGRIVYQRGLKGELLWHTHPPLSRPMASWDDRRTLEFFDQWESQVVQSDGSVFMYNINVPNTLTRENYVRKCY
ncbi:MAG: RHS repeat-associated core domain-containing protein, partial [Pirellula sp.]